MRFILAAIIACVVLGGADQAYGWGPATHVGLGADVLAQLALLPAAVAAILARHRRAFLYGSIAADIVFAKRLSRVKQFCHHWSTAFRVFDGADDDESKAFGYGYLAHLAADTVAHGQYIPHQVIASGMPVGFGHLYWELRADASAPADTWDDLARLLARNHSRFHQMLADHIKGTFLWYRLNRTVFDGVNAVAVKPTFRRTVDAVHRRSRWPLPSKLLGCYHDACVDRILSVLAEDHRSPVLKDDPNGTATLMQLHVARRRLRRMQRGGLPMQPRIHEATHSFAPRPTPRGGSAVAVSDSGDAEVLLVDRG